MSIAGHRHDRSAIVLYGSETGNALDYAEELGRITERLHFRTLTTNLDAVDLECFKKHSVVIVIISTTGQGDVPNNARLCWKKLLRRKLPLNYLENVNFTSFGLGDSSYPKFNWAARKLHKRFVQLGASELYPRGEADEQHEEGLDAAWIPWSMNIRQHLLTFFPLTNDFSPLSDDILFQPKWQLSFREDSFRHEINGISDAEKSSCHAVDVAQSLTHRNPIWPVESLSGTYPKGPVDPVLSVTLTENRRLTPLEHWQDVRHLRFQSTSRINYVPGDVLTVYPQNSDRDVDQMLSCMGWHDVADQLIQFTYTRPSFEPDFDLPPLASQRTQPNLTLRQLLTNNLDLTAIPRRSFFSTIAHFTDNKMHKERLLEFANPKYIDELHDYTSRPRRGVLEVLQEFDSVKIPWQWAADVIPTLRSRQFSIASGGPLKAGSEGQGHFELLVAIVKYKTVIQRLREGLCTRYLARLEPGSSIEIKIQQGGLHMQKAEAHRPVIMIGPGTGVAPLRSMIWERYQWQKELSKHQIDTKDQPADGSLSIGETNLFYGGRNKEADYFFKDEWEYLATKMPLRVFTAFSRDQKAKVYVQDIMRQQADLIHRALYFHHGRIYVCGSSGKMPSAVRVALVDIFRSSGDIDQSSAESYLQEMEKTGRYKQETW